MLIVLKHNNVYLFGSVSEKQSSHDLNLNKMDQDPKQCQAGVFKRRKSGQTKCPQCNTAYNNAAVPAHCTNETCKQYLGGEI